VDCGKAISTTRLIAPRCGVETPAPPPAGVRGAPPQMTSVQISRGPVHGEPEFAEGNFVTTCLRKCWKVEDTTFGYHHSVASGRGTQQWFTTPYEGDPI